MSRNGVRFDGVLQTISSHCVPGPASCVLWNESVDSVVYRSGVWSVYRLAYTAANGDIPHGYIVRQMCGREKCILPEHLTTRPRWAVFLDAREDAGLVFTGVPGVMWNPKDRMYTVQVDQAGSVYHGGNHADIEAAQSMAQSIMREGSL